MPCLRRITNCRPIVPLEIKIWNTNEDGARTGLWDQNDKGYALLIEIFISSEPVKNACMDAISMHVSPLSHVTGIRGTYCLRYSV